jgi:hypothetical protein
MTSWLGRLVAWIETLRLHNVMQTVDWAVPAVQTVHLLAIAAVTVFLILTHRLARLDPPDRATWVERALGGLLVLLWFAIIGCGRWIAYS